MVHLRTYIHAHANMLWSSASLYSEGRILVYVTLLRARVGYECVPVRGVARTLRFGHRRHDSPKHATDALHTFSNAILANREPLYPPQSLTALTKVASASSHQSNTKRSTSHMDLCPRNRNLEARLRSSSSKHAHPALDLNRRTSPYTRNSTYHDSWFVRSPAPTSALHNMATGRSVLAPR